MTLRIEIPGLPPRELNPNNSRIHPAVIWKATKAAKAKALRAIWGALGYPETDIDQAVALFMLKDGPVMRRPTPIFSQGARVTTRFIVPTKRRRDKGNLI